MLQLLLKNTYLYAFIVIILKKFSIMFDIKFYKLYNLFMNKKKNNFPFADPTHFNLPIFVYQTLFKDAVYFGFLKNNTPSVSGLLNHLIPNLSDYRNDLHLTFLKNNNGNKQLTIEIEKNIYNTYFSKYDYCDDGNISVSFRANNAHLEQLLNIYDNVFYTYDTTFTQFVRSILIEYSSKRLNQREYFFFYKEMQKIKNAITNSQQCVFYLKNEKLCFVPISIELSFKGERNYLIGYDNVTQKAYVFPIALLKRTVVNNIKYELCEEEISFVYDYFKEYEISLEGGN